MQLRTPCKKCIVKPACNTSCINHISYINLGELTFIIFIIFLVFFTTWVSVLLSIRFGVGWFIALMVTDCFLIIIVSEFTIKRKKKGN